MQKVIFFPNVLFFLQKSKELESETFAYVNTKYIPCVNLYFTVLLSLFIIKIEWNAYPVNAIYHRGGRLTEGRKFNIRPGTSEVI